MIYRLLEDVEAIAGSLLSQEYAEEIVGTAKVIAFFKSSLKDIIPGSKVLTGKLVQGGSFRKLGAMGLIYFGTIESIHIERDAAREARKGRQVRLKIRNFTKVKIADLFENFQSGAGQQIKPWRPHGKFFILSIFFLSSLF